MGLTSLSTECVLSHLSKSKRLVLFDRCPQLRPVDRRVPLKLDHFSVEDTTIRIDSTTYKIGIVRHYQNGVRPPPWVRESNATGGLTVDDGIIANPNGEKVSVFRQDRAPTIQEKTAKEDAERKLQELLPKLKEHNAHYIQEKLETEVKHLQKIVISYKEKLAISELKYTNYIQLTKIGDDGVVQHERILYQFPIQDAVEYITDLLLRSRKIRTEPFTFIGNSFISWPERLKISVSTFNYEIQFIDRNLVSIEFPTKHVRFENFYNVEFQTTRHHNRFTFEMKENDLEDAILNILDITENPRTMLADVKEKVQDMEPYRFFKSVGDHGSRFTVKKIRDGKLPSTRGDYRIEIDFDREDMQLPRRRPLRRQNNIRQMDAYPQEIRQPVYPQPI